MGILAAILLFLAFTDYLITVKVLGRFGVEAELNKLIVVLSTKVGLKAAIALGIFPATLIFILAATALHVPALLVILITLRSYLLFRQLRVHGGWIFEGIKIWR